MKTLIPEKDKGKYHCAHCGSGLWVKYFVPDENNREMPVCSKCVFLNTLFSNKD
jgi:transcription elongation factor Elf1